MLFLQITHTISKKYDSKNMIPPGFLDSYSQIEEHQDGDQENPGFHGIVWNQIHYKFPPAILSTDFASQLIV